MIVERLTFRAKYGHGDALVALLKERATNMAGAAGVGHGAMRVYTDATGPMFTVQVETEFADWASHTAWTQGEQQTYASSEFQEWFGRMMQHTELGERQLLNVETV